MSNNLVVCGGTFDHFHKGHESLLKLAFSLGRKVIIGVVSDRFVEKSKIKNQKSKIEVFDRRRLSVLDFLEKEKLSNKAEIVKIDDLFGPTLGRNLPIDAIVVSQDSKKGAEIINQKREELGLKDLNILVTPSVYGEDRNIISSEKIRKGEINREGKLYVNPLWLKTDLVLPENLRKGLKKPFGTLDFDVLKHQNQFTWVAAVGDVTTKKLNQLSVNQKISAIDFKVARQKAFSSFSDLGFLGGEIIITADNPAGHITHDLFSKVLDIFKSSLAKRVILKIEGEEDLAVLPLILVAPLGTVIYYGQPNKGLVRVIVSEESKDKAYELISRFKMTDGITRGY